MFQVTNMAFNCRAGRVKMLLIYNIALRLLYLDLITLKGDFD